MEPQRNLCIPLPQVSRARVLGECVHRRSKSGRALTEPMFKRKKENNWVSHHTIFLAYRKVWVKEVLRTISHTCNFHRHTRGKLVQRDYMLVYDRHTNPSHWVSKAVSPDFLPGVPCLAEDSISGVHLDGRQGMVFHWGQSPVSRGTMICVCASAHHHFGLIERVQEGRAKQKTPRFTWWDSECSSSQAVWSLGMFGMQSWLCV